MRTPTAVHSRTGPPKTEEKVRSEALSTFVQFDCSDLLFLINFRGVCEIEFSGWLRWHVSEASTPLFGAFCGKLLHVVASLSTPLD